LAKQEVYQQQKEIRREVVKQRLEENLKKVINPNEPVTNYPGKGMFLRRQGDLQTRMFYRGKVLSAIINDDPKIVFDFRFLPKQTRTEHVVSVYRQLIEVIHHNREVAHSSTQVHFCNYQSDSKFNQRFGPALGLDENLLFETEKSYTDLFPKEKLVYLSRDAKHTMQDFDPEKIYIIGCIVDDGKDTFKYSSVNQAQMDGIRCERLPLERYVK
jgi:ribonuclease P protein 1